VVVAVEASEDDVVSPSTGNKSSRPPKSRYFHSGRRVDRRSGYMLYWALEL
jgi:hypothetical protein